MKRFFYFLNEQPQYPNEILAESKKEVKNLLMDSLADESSILKILSEEEFSKSMNPNVKGIYADANDYNNGNDFLNDVIKSATNFSINKEKQEKQEMQEKQEKQEKIIFEETKNIEKNNEKEITNNKELNESENVENDENYISNVKYFEESGIQFKLENDKLYKKVWTKITDDELKEFRLIRVSSGKPIDFSKYNLEKLDWVEI